MTSLSLSLSLSLSRSLALSLSRSLARARSLALSRAHTHAHAHAHTRTQAHAESATREMAAANARVEAVEQERDLARRKGDAAAEQARRYVCISVPNFCISTPSLRTFKPYTPTYMHATVRACQMRALYARNLPATHVGHPRSARPLNNTPPPHTRLLSLSRAGGGGAGEHAEEVRRQARGGARGEPRAQG
jgi:hypothetical protein